MPLMSFMPLMSAILNDFHEKTIWNGINQFVLWSQIWKIKQSWARHRKGCSLIFTYLVSFVKMFFESMIVVINLPPIKLRQCITKCQKSSFFIKIHFRHVNNTFANWGYYFRVLDSNESCSHFWIALRLSTFNKKSLVIVVFPKFEYHSVHSEFDDFNLNLTC